MTKLIYSLIQLFLLSSTAAAPTSSEGSNCVAFANLYPAFQSVNTDQILGVTDQATCEARCRVDPTCFSYQINTNPGQILCWHQQYEKCLDPNEMFVQPNVAEYIKTNCSPSTSRPSGPTSVCWNVFPTQYSINGVLQNFFDVLSCRNYCVSVPACVAIDFDASTNPPCLIHTSTSDLQQDSTYNDNPAVNQHQINRSGTCTSISSGSSSTGSTVSTASTSQTSRPTTGPNCVAWVNLYPGLNSILTYPIIGVTDEATCEAICRVDPACFSYQINTNIGQTYCWIQKHLDQLDPNEMANQLNVVEYIKTNCSPVRTAPLSLPVSTSTKGPNCVAFVNLYPALQSILTDPIIGVTDEATCEAICRVDPACFSYQINTIPGQNLCWIQKHQDQLDPNEMANQPNVVEYIKTNCFLSAARSAPLSPPVSTSSTKVSTVASVAVSSLTSLQAAWTTPHSVFASSIALRTTPHGLPLPSSSEAARTTLSGLTVSTPLKAARTTPLGVQETTSSKVSAARTTPPGLPVSTPSKDANIALP